MEALVAEGITRLLVEGGPVLWRAFAAQVLPMKSCIIVLQVPLEPRWARRLFSPTCGVTRQDQRSLLPIGRRIGDDHDFNALRRT